MPDLRPSTTLAYLEARRLYPSDRYMLMHDRREGFVWVWDHLLSCTVATIYGATDEAVGGL